MTREEIVSAVEVVLQDNIPSEVMSNHDVQILASRVADKVAHLTLSTDDRITLEKLRGSDVLLESEDALLGRLLGATP